MASLKNLLRLVVACVLLIQQESVWAAQENAFQFFEEEAKVTTASKTSQSISDATSVMTVITADDLARWGTRTLYEALKRVPGFFPTSQATWPLVGSRGLVADGNDHLLLLISATWVLLGTIGSMQSQKLMFIIKIFLSLSLKLQI
jgi:outer membrane cobalamin receptor